mgnify:CR=1 FL=1
MRMCASLSLCLVLVGVWSAPAAAQAPPAPPPVPKIWSETASVGYALTSGNKDTSTLNAGYEIIYDPQRRNLVKSDGLYLRGTSEGLVTAERLVVNGRDEYRFHPRAFTFAQIQYVQDRFKNIDYLVAPTAGLGLRALDTPETKLSFDTGLGGVWEKSPELGALTRTSGAFTYAEKFSHQLTATTTITQAVSALHKTDNFGDALFNLNAGVSAALTTRVQMKAELLDTYKRLVVGDGVVKNDVAVVLAFVYKN